MQNAIYFDYKGFKFDRLFLPVIFFFEVKIIKRARAILYVREVEARKRPMPGEFIIKNLQNFNNYHYVINVTAQKFKKKTHKNRFFNRKRREVNVMNKAAKPTKRKLTTILAFNFFLAKTIDNVNDRGRSIDSRKTSTDETQITGSAKVQF